MRNWRGSGGSTAARARDGGRDVAHGRDRQRQPRPDALAAAAGMRGVAGDGGRADRRCARPRLALMLELYPNAPLREEMARGALVARARRRRRGHVLVGDGRLDAAGYHAVRDLERGPARRESRHNLKYWQDGAWLGFGCGAHSTRGARRWKNVAGDRRVRARGSRLAASPVAERRARDDDERLEDALFTGLRLTEGLDLAASRGALRRGCMGAIRRGAPAARRGRPAGLRATAALRLTRAGMLVANDVMTVFV